MANIHPGYMGVITLGAGGPNIRFGDCSLNIKQSALIPDLVMGHWDHAAYNMGKIEVGGGISGPVTASFAAGATSVWNWGYTRDLCGKIASKDVKVYYYCDAGSTDNVRSFTGLFCNSVGFSCAAGDVAQFTIEAIGTGVGTPFNSTATPPLNTVTEKLVTWDNCAPTLTAGTTILNPTTSGFSNFEFTVNNNAEAIWVMESGNSFYPSAVVAGLRTITGSLSSYDPSVFAGITGYNSPAGWNADTSRATISFNIGGTSISFRVMFHRPEATLNTGPIISTIGFTGVGVQP